MLEYERRGEAGLLKAVLSCPFASTDAMTSALTSSALASESLLRNTTASLWTLGCVALTAFKAFLSSVVLTLKPVRDGFHHTECKHLGRRGHALRPDLLICQDW